MPTLAHERDRRHRRPTPQSGDSVPSNSPRHIEPIDRSPRPTTHTRMIRTRFESAKTDAPIPKRHRHDAMKVIGR
ncbi:hypothetical protein C446_06305 [Halobiforma nitratireducens JCM 10879]|uniref:Uncharacterized protein n=1 Tax=Halobiforma nitratireducens JCM 10879 TaxID=1227454 RepID=M0M5R1_9EURY|nr:hypothetical protein C446_06305 [Halobiforma nitratireducens JCM 10879]